MRHSHRQSARLSLSGLKRHLSSSPPSPMPNQTWENGRHFSFPSNMSRKPMQDFCSDTRSSRFSPTCLWWSPPLSLSLQCIHHHIHHHECRTDFVRVDFFFQQHHNNPQHAVQSLPYLHSLLPLLSDEDEALQPITLTKQHKGAIRAIRKVSANVV